MNGSSKFILDSGSPLESIKNFTPAFSHNSRTESKNDTFTPFGSEPEKQRKSPLVSLDEMISSISS